MPNSVLLSRRAEKFLAGLTDAALYRRVRASLDILEQDARPPGCLKLAAAPDLYRIRVGEYRIVYQISDQTPTVLILSIGHRREIYRR